MYEPENDPRIGGADSEAERAAKREMIHAFDSLHSASDKEKKQLWKIINVGYKQLKAELKRKMDEYEKQMREKQQQ